MRRDLARKHLDNRLSQWRPTSAFVSPPRGWIRGLKSNGTKSNASLYHDSSLII